MEFFVLLANESDAQFMKVGLFTFGAATSTSTPIFATNSTKPGWKKVSVDFSTATQAIADTVNIRSSVGNVV